MTSASHSASTFPLPFDQYPASPDGTLFGVMVTRMAHEPFNVVATTIFLLAVAHTFLANRFTALSHHVQHAHDRRLRARGRPPEPSTLRELLHFLGEFEVVFGLWAVVLVAAMTASFGWSGAREYVSSKVNFTEPMFVVVIMAMAATQPIVSFAEATLGKVARLGGGTPGAWWLVILTLGPILGSFITEQAAMTICALLLGQQFYARRP